MLVSGLLLAAGSCLLEVAALAVSVRSNPMRLKPQKLRFLETCFAIPDLTIP